MAAATEFSRKSSVRSELVNGNVFLIVVVRAEERAECVEREGVARAVNSETKTLWRNRFAQNGAGKFVRALQRPSARIHVNQIVVVAS